MLVEEVHNLDLFLLSSRVSWQTWIMWQNDKVLCIESVPLQMMELGMINNLLRSTL